jgi:general secretion pathway protein B
MSYILDALQRAEAERERGHVPGLKSQIVQPASPKAMPVRRWKPVHTMAVAAVALIAAGAWWWFSQPDQPPVAAPTPAPAPTAAPAAPVAEAPAAVRPAPAPATPVQPILAPPREEPPKRAAAPAAPVRAAPAAPTATTPASPAPAQASAAPAAASAAPDANAAPVRSFAELSPEARAQLPQVSVSGSTYSKNPALRMLIVNGKVLQEGQEIAPGFKLETIGQRSAVLNHNGLRYSIGY